MRGSRRDANYTGAIPPSAPASEAVDIREEDAAFVHVVLGEQSSEFIRFLLCGFEERRLEGIDDVDGLRLAQRLERHRQSGLVVVISVVVEISNCWTTLGVKIKLGRAAECEQSVLRTRPR